MGKIIMFGGTKGGGGKTTAACNTAVIRAIELSQQSKRAKAADPTGGRLLLADSDKMQVSHKFAVRRDEAGHTPAFLYESMTGITIHKKLKERRSLYHDIIVDSGGHDSVELRSALMEVDELIVPIRPNTTDTDTLPELHRLLEENEVYNPNLRIRVFMSQVRPGTYEAKREQLEALLEHFPLLRGTLMRAHLTLRATYEICQGSGQGVVEFARKNEVALSQMRELHKEIWES